MKKIYIVFLIFFLSSCTSKTPDYVIPHDKMVDIIVDIHKLDGLLTINEVRKDIANIDTLNLYNEVLKFHGYTRKDFDTSIYYYSKNIAEYDKIYGDVLNRLGEMETKLKGDLNSEQAKDGK